MSNGSTVAGERSTVFAYFSPVVFIVLPIFAVALFAAELIRPQDKSLKEYFFGHKSDDPNRSVPGVPGTSAPNPGTPHPQEEVRAELEQLRSTLESERAVQSARRVAATARLRRMREQLAQLTTLEAGWRVKWVGLLTDEAGRRVIASVPHRELLMGLADRQRPTEGQLAAWNDQLDALARPIDFGPIDQSSAKSSAPAISDLHEKSLADLGTAISAAWADFDEQQALLQALLQETKSIEAGITTLADAIAQRTAELAKQREQVLLVARQEGVKQQQEQLAKRERDRIDEDTRREEDQARAEEKSRQQAADLELEKVRAEARVEEAKRRAEIAGLDAVTSQAKAALAKAQLEREFARDYPVVRQYAHSFMADGYDLRPDKTKGPASLSIIEGRGGLVQSEDGLKALYNYCIIHNQRGPGPIVPPTRKERFAPLEKCQGFLLKYGQLMVEKGLLAP